MYIYIQDQRERASYALFIIGWGPVNHAFVNYAFPQHRVYTVLPHSTHTHTPHSLSHTRGISSLPGEDRARGAVCVYFAPRLCNPPPPSRQKHTVYHPILRPLHPSFSPFSSICRAAHTHTTFPPRVTTIYVYIILSLALLPQQLYILSARQRDVIRSAAACNRLPRRWCIRRRRVRGPRPLMSLTTLVALRAMHTHP